MMKTLRKAFCAGLVLSAALLGSVGFASAEIQPGAAGQPAATDAKTVKPGDAVDLNFTCRLKNGEVVASTDRSKLQGATFSRVFQAKEKDGPVVVTAVAKTFLGPKERFFEDEITDRLAGLITGMKQGESRTVELTSQDLPERAAKDYVTSIAHVWQRPKVMKMTPGDYEFRARKKAEVGQAFIFYPSFPGKVESVSDTEVVVLFAFEGKPGSEIETPFGRAKVTEDDANYLVEINAAPGSLVRSGAFVGRVTKVTTDRITLDYRHPFGGETLYCDMTVEKGAPEQQVSKAQEK